MSVLMGPYRAAQTLTLGRAFFLERERERGVGCHRFEGVASCEEAVSGTAIPASCHALPERLPFSLCALLHRTQLGSLCIYYRQHTRPACSSILFLRSSVPVRSRTKRVSTKTSALLYQTHEYGMRDIETSFRMKGRLCFSSCRYIAMLICKKIEWKSLIKKKKRTTYIAN